MLDYVGGATYFAALEGRQCQSTALQSRLLLQATCTPQTLLYSCGRVCQTVT